MQKLTLRFVVVGLIYYGFAVIEGMIMRIYQVEPLSMINSNQYFAILTAHPLVCIFGSTYSLVFGAFLFLVPYLMKKPIWSYRLANFTFLLLASARLHSGLQDLYYTTLHYIHYIGPCRLISDSLPKSRCQFFFN